MAKCVFCHGDTTHTEACPQAIPTRWGPGSGVWPELARNLLEAWRQDTSVYDRGDSEDVLTMEALWEGVAKALDQGRAEEAMACLFRHYGGPRVGPTEGVSQGASTEGVSQEGPYRGAHIRGPS